MPEKITLSDGTEREVPTQEEMTNFQNAHKELETLKPQFDSLKETLELQEGESLTDKISELKDSANPNWKEARTVIKNLKTALKEKDIEVDDSGNILSKPQSLTREEAEKIAEETYQKTATAGKKAEILSKFQEAERKSIEAIFDKLNAVGGSFEENMELAISKVVPSQKNNPLNNAVTFGGGGAPRINKNNKGLSDDVKQFAMEKFGLSEDDLKNT